VRAGLLVCAIASSALASGCFVLQKDFDALKAQDEALAKRVQADEADLAAALARFDELDRPPSS